MYNIESQLPLEENNFKSNYNYICSNLEQFKLKKKFYRFFKNH